MKIFHTIIILSIFLVLSSASAQIHRTLSYQGVLTDAAGKPRDNDTHSFTFTFCLYETSSGGSSLWCEQKELLVTNGLFSTILGDKTPFGPNVKFDRPYWLGIQVGNEPELSPRIALTSVGYSISSLHADTAMVTLNTNNFVQHSLTIDLTGYSGLMDETRFLSKLQRTTTMAFWL